jgi:hypothetical protein
MPGSASGGRRPEAARRRLEGGYQYEINYPNAKHQTYVDGDYIDGSSDRSSKAGPATFWGSGNHVVAIYMDEPDIVKRVSFTMC